MVDALPAARSVLRVPPVLPVLPGVRADVTPERRLLDIVIEVMVPIVSDDLDTITSPAMAEDVGEHTWRRAAVRATMLHRAAPVARVDPLMLVEVRVQVVDAHCGRLLR